MFWSNPGTVAELSAAQIALFQLLAIPRWEVEMSTTGVSDLPAFQNMTMSLPIKPWFHLVQDPPLSVALKQKPREE